MHGTLTQTFSKAAGTENLTWLSHIALTKPGQNYEALESMYELPWVLVPERSRKLTLGRNQGLRMEDALEASHWDGPIAGPPLSF